MKTLLCNDGKGIFENLLNRPQVPRHEVQIHQRVYQESSGSGKTVSRQVENIFLAN